jgi:imidazole glycerol-phosphate synthase subunit HisF
MHNSNQNFDSLINLPRIIPCLLVKNNKLVKTVRFKNPQYVGDPINAVKIYNQKEVDELIVLNIDSWQSSAPPNYELLKLIAEECFMPLCYGGGVSSLEHAKKVFALGVEKIAINSALISNPKLITEIAEVFGSQSVVASVDLKKDFFGKYRAYYCGGTKNSGIEAIEFCKKLEKLKAGELLITNINREGSWNGYDLELLQKCASAVNIPIIANGGAGTVADLTNAIKNGRAAAAAAGSMFVFSGKNRGVLINFPKRELLLKEFSL